MAHARPPAIVPVIALEEHVGFVHTEGDEAGSVAGANACASASKESGGQLEGRSPLLVGLRQSLRPGDDRLTYGLPDLRGPQLSFLAQAHDDDGFGARHEGAAIEIRTAVDEDLVRADRDRIHTHLERLLHGAADQPIHDLFGPCQLHRPIVAEHQHLGLECQVAVGDGDSQRLSRVLRAAAKRFRRWSRRFSLSCRTMGASVMPRAARAQQPATGQTLRGSTPFSGCCRRGSALTRKSAVSA